MDKNEDKFESWIIICPNCGENDTSIIHNAGRYEISCEYGLYCNNCGFETLIQE